MIIFLMALLIAACFSVLLNFPFIYIISFVLLCYSPIVIIIATGWYLLRKVAGKSNNKSLIEFVAKIEKLNKWKCFFTCVLALACLLLFVYGRLAINRYYMPHSLSAVRVTFKIVLLAATVLLFWGYTKTKKKTIPVICTVLYILFIVLAPVFALFSGRETIVDDQSLQDQFGGLGYVRWAPAANTGDVSVTIYDPNLAFEGYNLYGGRDPYTHLIDMEGNLLHTWQTELEDDASIYSEMLGNGDLLTVVIDRRFVKLDWDSNVLWETGFRAHHDFHVAENGEIYALARKDSIVFYKGVPFPILEDYIAVLSSEGRLIKSIDIYESIENEYSWEHVVKIYKEILKPKTVMQMISKKITGKDLFRYDRFLDIMHVNTVELLDRDIPGVGKKDDILLSIREIDIIAVLDSDNNQLAWKWGLGHLSKQHRPTVLDNNNILVFDNGRSTGFSQILEIDPVNKKIMWNYNSDNTRDFYSARGGACQPLPNNNILISQTQAGRIFEITREGEIVWEYFNPNVYEEASERETIFVLERLQLSKEVIDKIQ